MAVHIDLQRLNRNVCRALRHDPAAFGVALDSDGWTNIDDLLRALRLKRRGWHDLKPEDIHLMAAATERRRYEIAGDRIRALYGHSRGVGRMSFEPELPPAALFHGTDMESALLILRDGLYRMKRQYVHLTADRQYAERITGKRPAEQVVLKVRAIQAQKCCCVEFYRASDHVWLAEYVPANVIELENSEALLPIWSAAAAIRSALNLMT